MALRYLIVPGWGDSGAAHWQTRLQADLDCDRVQMTDWQSRRRADWVDAVERAITRVVSATGDAPVAIAHSLGCTAVAHVAARGHVPLAAALRVAPPDLDRDGCPDELRDLAPVPRAKLACPATVVASDDDPYAELAAARALADAWGALFVPLHAAGHINTASGHGEWPLGRVLAQQLAALARAAA